MGVYHSSTGKWIAKFTYQARNYSAGIFHDEAEAARAYDAAAKSVLRDCAILNFLPDGSLNSQRHQILNARR